MWCNVAQQLGRSEYVMVYIHCGWAIFLAVVEINGSVRTFKCEAVKIKVKSSGVVMCEPLWR